ELVANYGQFFERNSAVDSPYKDLFSLLHLTRKVPHGQITLTVQYVGEHPELITQFLDAVEAQGMTRRPPRVAVGYHQIVAPTTDTRHMPWLEATQTLNGSGPNQRGKYKSAYMRRGFPAEQIAAMWEYLACVDYSNPQALLQVDSYGC